MEALALTLTILFYSVIDGDTLHSNGIGIRLWGIDAPEMDSADGNAARLALIDITQDQMLICNIRDIDSYGRIVAQCRLPDQTDVSCELVRRGAARDWPKYSGGAYRDCD